MKSTIIILIILLSTCFQTFAQHLGLTFQDAEKQGILTSKLDSIYQSAVNSDTSKAVFKTEKEQQAMGEAYIKLLQDFGKFLTDNNFVWSKKTRCFNRIYFNNDGTIDYFLFNFLGETEDKPSEENQNEFKRILNLFIKDYQILPKANTKFVQCSPTNYMPQKLQ
ncbi:MAG: hypothetical protein LBV69_00330 [Bacteroidales bacterium]|jgi:hypothetical protein|nr:hypothetical protein [Bacteroidales bacterium]